MKFLDFCVRNKAKINFIVLILCGAIILISTYGFGNDYFKTDFHWIISLFGCFIIWFVSLCIVDIETPQKHLKNTSKTKQIKQTKTGLDDLKKSKKNTMSEHLEENAEQGERTPIPPRELTYGEKAVGLTFNHGEGEIHESIHEAKTTCAKAIDQMNNFRNATTSGESRALYTIAIRKLQSAQMDMVKAITWKD